MKSSIQLCKSSFPMRLAIGSLNPVKLRAVSQITTQIWPTVSVEGVVVPSGVSDMPMSDDETMLGAKNRAAAARAALDADLGFGLEGGVHPWQDGLVLTGWVAVVDRNGVFGIGGCGRLPLPARMSQRVLAGEELGIVIDDLTNDQNSKQKEGAVGVLTDGLLTRADAFKTGVAFALAPFVARNFYKG